MEIVHVRNTAYPLVLPLVDSATPALFKTGVTPTVVAYHKDGANAWTAFTIANTPAEIGTTGVYSLAVTATELNRDMVLMVWSGTGVMTSMVLFNMTQKPAYLTGLSATAAGIIADKVGDLFGFPATVTGTGLLEDNFAITAAGLDTTNDAYAGCYLLFTSGVNRGVARRISQFFGTPGVLSFNGGSEAPDRPFPHAPTAGDKVMIIGQK